MKRHLGILIFIIAVSCRKASELPRLEPQRDIIFSRKAFFDSAKTTDDGYVYVAGTLTGEGIPYPNNTTAIVCYRDRMECISYGVNQIGPNQIGRLDSPLEYPVTKWDRFEIVASGPGDAFNCRKDTLSIVRDSELVVWVQEPINQTAAACSNADTRLLKWKLEDPSLWRTTSSAGK